MNAHTGEERQGSTPPAGTTDRSRIPPAPEIIAAVEFLRTQPDAASIRRRYLELITPGNERDGTTIDYTAAERYLLATAARYKRQVRLGSRAEQGSGEQGFTKQDDTDGR
ncbi:MAG: hypothetical protein EOP31_09305 [Rhodococcus sp. (in: high G+C Gram-positive bacteria)]|uniref:hypothetical protein n=1 Tax=Rhodococcus sp. TaxID=1831 RepID=UPI0012268887|nr:hypothetical protein [Rhodococcus sp. (in: high G+C Gram-positive bacteria)]RZL25306.1 MAG: hypothetical protein EOP31_09305 [Rhodococcus sp. (in: high G+C Gram-positive bacteria)]